MELWKPVFGYHGLYEVSNLGNVRSLERKRLTKKGLQRWPGKNLRPFLDTNGYLYVNLSNGSTAKKTSLHSIVLEAFVCQRPHGLIALHNDGNRTNCTAENLRWGSYADNSADAKRHGTLPSGDRSPKAILSTELVERIKSSHQSSIELGKILGVASSTVRAVRIGQNWNHA